MDRNVLTAVLVVNFSNLGTHVDVFFHQHLILGMSVHNRSISVKNSLVSYLYFMPHKIPPN